MKRQIMFVLMLCACTLTHAQGRQAHGNDRETRRMAAMTSAVKVNNMQREAMHNAMIRRSAALDAVETAGSDAREATFRKYEIEKKCHEEIVSQLSDRQIAEYCEVTFAPEVTAKTDYRMSLLTEVDNDYTEAELQKMRKDIYSYLMLEKIVYYKYKYDYAKQKENISRLKAIQPAALKSAVNNEKQKSYGKVTSGRVQWRQKKGR